MNNMSSHHHNQKKLPPLTCDVPAPLSAGSGLGWHVSSDAECLQLWDKFDMLENVRRHSHAVADVATDLAELGIKQGFDVDVQLVRASALLHDIAKTYSIFHGGNHSQLGGAWVQEETGNPLVASGVTHHVFWPFELDIKRFFPQLAVLYADKRVRHDSIVDIPSRFEDLIKRYGVTQRIRDRIIITRDQALEVEKVFSDAIKVDLNEHTFDRRRMEQ